MPPEVVSQPKRMSPGKEDNVKSRMMIAAMMLTAVSGWLRPAMAEEVWQTRTWDELKAEAQARADRSAYPLAGLRADDVRDVLGHITSLDRDEWATAWMRMGDRYMAKAKAEKTPAAARADYFQAWRNYTLGRWPVPNAAKKLESYGKAREAFAAYGQLIEPKIERVRIPFEGKEVVGYLQKPKGIRAPPVLINIGGVDQWKDSAADASRPMLEKGIAIFSVDMPGTGESPLGGQPGAERMYSAVIDYLLTRHDLDGHRLVVRGQSWGSYWSARVALAEPNRLRGAVFQSGPVDAYFQRAWQNDSLKTKEYLFDFVPSRLYILGKASVEEMLDTMPTMALTQGGLIDKPTPPMLLIGGVHDTQTPISDLLLLMQHGTAKYAWINPTGGHMGRSASMKDEVIIEAVIMPWITQQLATK